MVASRLRPFEHAVARDVGVDDGGDAGILEAPRESSAVSSRVSAQPSTATLPSRASRPTAMRPGNVARRLVHQRRIAHRRGADDHAVDALVEPGLDRGQVADAAAELHADMSTRSRMRLDGRGVHRLAGEGAVEIDDMQIFEALRARRLAPARPDRG